MTIAIILIFIVGLAFLFYPAFSDYYNSKTQSRAVASYNEAVNKMSEQDLSMFWDAAYLYNSRLDNKLDRFIFSDEDLQEYNSLLNITTGGIMGTLEIEVINVKLSIYHGTSEGVLQIGTGHFEGSSLPVGGPGSHSVITGHRGLPSAALLTNLDRMEIGDTFALHVLNESIWYQVDQITVVEPTDLSELDIMPDMDLCTLVTCTPLGVNSHRLLVRGHRVDGPDAAKPIRTVIRTEAGRIKVIMPILFIVLPITVVVAIIWLVRLNRRLGKIDR